MLFLDLQKILNLFFLLSMYAIGQQIQDTEKMQDVAKWYTSNLLQGNFSEYKAISIIITSRLVKSIWVLKLLKVAIDEKFKSREVMKRASKQVGDLVHLCNIGTADLLPHGMQGSKFIFGFGSPCATRCKFLGALLKF